MMSARIFVLCLLSFIISTVAPLKCQTCFASKGECKNEDMKLVECGADKGHCISLSFRSTMIHPSLSITAKSCAKTEHCAKGYYVVTSLADKFHQMRVECCEKDGCNTAPLPLPAHDLMKTNGFICPGSYEQNGRSELSGPVLCLGDEDQCVSAKLSYSAMSAYNCTMTHQGCTNKRTCAYPRGETELAGGLLHFSVEKLECQDAMRLGGWNGFSNTFGWGWN